MRPPNPAALAGAAALAAVCAGCGIADPYQRPAPTPAAGTTTLLNEVSTPPPRAARTPVLAPAPTPAAAVEQFARLYINWDYRTLAGIQRRLSAMSVGEASATNARAAAHTPADYELRRGRVANRGHIAAIAPARPPHRWAYVVVTVERTTGSQGFAGLRPAYHVTLATAQPVEGGWAISRWEPQA
jgi:hypothetical protein